MIKNIYLEYDYDLYLYSSEITNDSFRELYYVKDIMDCYIEGGPYCIEVTGIKTEYYDHETFIIDVYPYFL
ncbi:hypothetical protein RLOatenuis_0730 [Rickettsiales bacterium]|nr:hypothetical protein RLOatenuis_0730 [Rickettsiales bacterium]